MAKGQLGEWVDKTLYPAMYRKLDEVFPTMKFVLSTLKNKWISPKNIDGTDPRHPKKDKTFVLESVYHLMQENGGGDTKDLITKFQEFNNNGATPPLLSTVSWSAFTPYFWVSALYTASARD